MNNDDKIKQCGFIALFIFDIYKTDYGQKFIFPKFSKLSSAKVCKTCHSRKFKFPKYKRFCESLFLYSMQV